MAFSTEQAKKIEHLELDVRAYKKTTARMAKEIAEQKNKILKKDMELDYFRKRTSWLTDQLHNAKEAAN